MLASVTTPIQRVRTSVGSGAIVLALGDITRAETDAIVNAANTSLLGGGGVDGAIHRAGGPEILAQCQAIRARQGGCPTGKAVITGGGRLPARWVIHAVGPRWQDGLHDEERLLRSAYQESLRLAREHAVASISFPSISTGIFGYPIELAARAALDVITSELTSNPTALDVHVVLFSERDLRDVYEGILTPGFEMRSALDRMVDSPRIKTERASEVSPAIVLVQTRTSSLLGPALRLPVGDG